MLLSTLLNRLCCSLIVVLGAYILPACSKSLTVRITAIACWRALLWRRLRQASVTNTKFVDALPAQEWGFKYDGANEGHIVILATQIVARRQLVGWLDSAKPDAVMMHLGMNDVRNDRPAAEQCGQMVVSLNQALPEWAGGKNTTESVIEEVDCWTGFNSRSMKGDGVQPINAGDEKLAGCCLSPLSRPIKAVGGWIGGRSGRIT
ncbi:hypothetical protein QBC36DRAFT_389367 [Triangularia setosa]|uniref:SGNH hydrolase-type esterase domain-containing protein n=1 Tax=Triangularia setosa TaxID=2587417 RepID=A0AAN6W2R7_9PEZI|nr:hypothetical protein QBC36DRAFT_389367 [Podospora setosa]